jgi:hypothetical protein
MLHAILELLASSDGYGKIFLAVDDTGCVAHTSSCIYVKPTGGETIPAFLRRVQGQARPGDAIEMSYEHGKLQLARITRPAEVLH